MRTPWGKRRGWEIQRLVIRGRVFWRLTGRNWCRDAEVVELALWRALPKELTKPSPNESDAEVKR